MSASINDFKAQFKGGARPTLYRVTMPFPTGVGSADAGTKLSFMCKGAVLPGSATGTIEVPYMGRNLKIAGDRTFNDITLTIVNDVDFAVRKAFEQWNVLMNQNEANTGATLPSDYMVDFTIDQFDREGNILKSYTIVGAFPTDLADIDLAYDSVDTIEEFTVTMTYQYFQDPINGII